MFKKIFECAPDAIVVTDSQGRVVHTNAQTQKLFGYSPDELLGEMVEVLVPERLRAVHVAHRESEPARHLARPFGALTDLYARRKDGSEFPADIMHLLYERRSLLFTLMPALVFVIGMLFVIFPDSIRLWEMRPH